MFEKTKINEKVAEDGPFCYINKAYLNLKKRAHLKLAEDADKLVEVDKVLGHVGGQHEIDDALTNQLVRVTVQVLEYVHLKCGR